MSTLKTNTIKNTDDVEMYLAKAWVNFNGTGTVAIRAAGNVSSITDNGTGNYTINFTNAMPDANYSVSGSLVGSSTSWASTTYFTADPSNTANTTSACRIGTRDAYSANGDTLRDHNCVSVIVFR